MEDLPGWKEDAREASRASTGERAAGEAEAAALLPAPTPDCTLVAPTAREGGELRSWLCLHSTSEGKVSNIALCSEAIGAEEGDESRFSRLSRDPLGALDSGGAILLSPRTTVGARDLVESAEAG